MTRARIAQRLSCKFVALAVSIAVSLLVFESVPLAVEPSPRNAFL